MAKVLNVKKNPIKTAQNMLNFGRKIKVYLFDGDYKFRTLGHHQVKLFSSLNLATGSPSDNFINFGHGHDYKFGSKMMSGLPIDAVGVMDRGFAGLKFIQELIQENKYFVLRIKNNFVTRISGINWVG